MDVINKAIWGKIIVINVNTIDHRYISTSICWAALNWKRLENISKAEENRTIEQCENLQEFGGGFDCCCERYCSRGKTKSNPTWLASHKILLCRPRTKSYA